MKHISLALLALCSASAMAAPASTYEIAPFEVRVVISGFVDLVNPRGDEYGALVDSTVVRPAFLACNKPANETVPHTIVLVTDVTPRGTATAVEVRPQTPMGKCMRDHLSVARWPYFGGLNGGGLQPVALELGFR